MPVNLEAEAWRHLERAVIEMDGRPIGVKAAQDPDTPALNYDQCFVRDFALCAPALLLRGRAEVVRNFLIETLRLQSSKRRLDCFQPGKGLMPASFRPIERDGETVIDADYGEESIARVTPVDSVFWWLLTLRAYRRLTEDDELHRNDDFQQGIRRILELTLQARFEMFPTLLVPDGSFMIDRRMGVYGHPLEVQSLFFAGLRAADELLVGDGEWREAARKRLPHLAYHVRRYYWLDRERLDAVANGGVDQYGPDVVNVLNIYPDSVPDWASGWLSDNSGYLAGNAGPGRIDYRFFAQGNLLAAMSALATQEQSQRLLTFYDERWDALIGDAPLRLCYPGYEGDAWRIVTGGDQKNRPWSYHNGGSWPCLLWSFAPVALRFGRSDLAERAVKAAETRLAADEWPEYYEGERERKVSESARRLQSWSMGAFLYAKACLADPELVDLFCWPDTVEERAC